MLGMRRLSPEDDIAKLTSLVRSAYQGLANMGLRYTATWQDDRTTHRSVIMSKSLAHGP